jgi:predicted Fe-S protein YdhL (DUF1289 family)
MSDGIWKRDEIESPCVKVCVVDPATGLCLGCFRTVDEIAGWSALTPEARRAVMAELPARRATRRPRRGGRAARLREHE